METDLGFIHHLALIATHEVGRPLVVLEGKIHSITDGLPVRRVHVVKGVDTIIAFKPGRVFNVASARCPVARWFLLRWRVCGNRRHRSVVALAVRG